MKSRKLDLYFKEFETHKNPSALIKNLVVDIQSLTEKFSRISSKLLTLEQAICNRAANIFLYEYQKITNQINDSMSKNHESINEYNDANKFVFNLTSDVKAFIAVTNNEKFYSHLQEDSAIADIISKFFSYFPDYWKQLNVKAQGKLILDLSWMESVPDFETLQMLIEGEKGSVFYQALFAVFSKKILNQDTTVEVINNYFPDLKLLVRRSKLQSENQSLGEKYLELILLHINKLFSDLKNESYIIPVIGSPYSGKSALLYYLSGAQLKYSKDNLLHRTVEVVKDSSNILPIEIESNSRWESQKSKLPVLIKFKNLAFLECQVPSSLFNWDSKDNFEFQL